jgi:hypothetical protein
MRRFPGVPGAAVAGLLVIVASGTQAKEPWVQEFPVKPGDLASTGRNPYFILEPGYVLVLEDGRERLVITVRDETRMIGGVETRVVEERETKGDRVVEVSRNYFAISRSTSDLYYFGEEVDTYKKGRIKNHDGAWLAGVNGARFGLMMPGTPSVGARYYQEVAPGVAMDRAEIVGMGETLSTPAGEFRDVLKVFETTPLELFSRGHKYYVPGIGLAQDGTLKLVKYGKAQP